MSEKNTTFAPQKLKTMKKLSIIMMAAIALVSASCAKQEEEKK